MSFEASCDTIVLEILIPFHELIVDPLFQKYLPSMLTRIWIGVALLVACTSSILLIYTFGYAMEEQEINCFLANPGSVLKLSPCLISSLVHFSNVRFHATLVES